MSNSDPLSSLLQQMARSADLPADEREELRLRAEHLSVTSSDDALALVHGVIDHLPAEMPPEAEPLVAALLEKLWRGAERRREPWPLTLLDAIDRSYRRLGSASPARHHLLRALATDHGPAGLALFAELLATDPPTDPHDVLLAFVPLLQRRNYPADALFPRLWDCMGNPSIATAVLDLSNYLSRQHVVARHPASDRVDQLAALLAGIVERLQLLAERPEAFARSPVELAKVVGDAVALTVALCDALALIGDDRIVDKLRRVLGLGHRHVRAEAAAALARLNDQAGTEALIGMAADPSVRRRVLAYLDELELLDRVDPEFRSPLAQAEGDLAAWLAEPANFAIPPSALELVDTRMLYWPGSAEPVTCWLLRYEFRLGERMLSNIGMAGPLTHALLADLQDLPPLDIYAVYAGWHAEHDEIRQTSAERLGLGEQSRWQSQQQELVGLGYEAPSLVKLGYFFGREQWVATAKREGRGGVVILDDGKVHWYPTSHSHRPLGASEIYDLHKGREILRTFNPE